MDQRDIRPETVFEFKENLKKFETLHYVLDRFSFARHKTREVKVGDLGIGGKNPIRVQTMTISDTQNIKAVVDEAELLAKGGAELVRITAPSQKDAECLKEIRAELNRRGCRVPICADIHFTPKAALVACEYVEKVRVNPGNFADKKVFAFREYTEREYQEELERIESAFSPLVKRAKELGRALRIGTNHGSLSDRIMNRYGDTPLGMVESALEFVEICRAHSFHDLVISMKASNPKVMIQAYRLLVARMEKLGYDYPLHLGVTEAGAGEDGRLKSAVGIGALLEDGIGDTVRVSLTEDSIHEIPVCYELIRRYTPHASDPVVRDAKKDITPLAGPLPSTRPKNARRYDDINPYAYRLRASQETLLASGGSLKVGGADVPTRVQVALSALNNDGSLDEVKALFGLNRDFDTEELGPKRGEPRPEILEVPVSKAGTAGLKPLRAFLKTLADHYWENALVLRFENLGAVDASLVEDGEWLAVPIPAGVEQAARIEQIARFLNQIKGRNIGVQWIYADTANEVPDVAAEIMLLAVQQAREAGVKRLMSSFELSNPVAAYRLLTQRCKDEKITAPILLREPLPCPLTSDDLRTASVFGSLLCDGIGDAVVIAARDRKPSARVRLAYNLLQCTGNRITKTEFISCPSCGRTLFNLQETTERIRSKMGHLKGVKLAIMGCIVNGPGEMADAHFGYVGAGPGRINLYVGKELVQKNIPQEIADERLIDLLKEHHVWEDPAR